MASLFCLSGLSLRGATGFAGFAGRPIFVVSDSFLFPPSSFLLPPLGTPLRPRGKSPVVLALAEQMLCRSKGEGDSVCRCEVTRDRRCVLVGGG
jgi:hypothetical protein